MLIMLYVLCSFKLDFEDEEKMMEVIRSCIGTKFLGQYGDLACKIALKAVKMITTGTGDKIEVDVKKWARIEKIPGGSIEDCEVLDGVMVNKDVTHARMRRRIEKPRVILLDCPLEYKKGESQTNVELSADSDFTKMLQLEEDHVKVCLGYCLYLAFGLTFLCIWSCKYYVTTDS